MTPNQRRQIFAERDAAYAERKRNWRTARRRRRSTVRPAARRPLAVRPGHLVEVSQYGRIVAVGICDTCQVSRLRLCVDSGFGPWIKYDSEHGYRWRRAGSKARRMLRDLRESLTRHTG